MAVATGHCQAVIVSKAGRCQESQQADYLQELGITAVWLSRSSEQRGHSTPTRIWDSGLSMWI
jgi:hypothetical protein